MEILQTVQQTTPLQILQRLTMVSTLRHTRVLITLVIDIVIFMVHIVLPLNGHFLVNKEHYEEGQIVRIGHLFVTE